MEITKRDIRKLDRSEIISFVTDNSYPKYRGQQIWEWIWKNKKVDFESMRTLPKNLKTDLQNHFFFAPCAIDQKQISIDGAVR